jgi:vacuolar-type H+-ATPase subunit H
MLDQQGSTAPMSERTQQTASAAKEEAGTIAEEAKDETRELAGEAKQQARTVVGEVQNDLHARADEEATKVAGTLHSAGEQLRRMAAAAPDGILITVALEGAGGAERLASRLDAGGLDAVATDLRRWARRNPGSFLLGATAFGFVAGRVLRHVNGSGMSPGTEDRDADHEVGAPDRYRALAATDTSSRYEEAP